MTLIEQNDKRKSLIVLQRVVLGIQIDSKHLRIILGANSEHLAFFCYKLRSYLRISLTKEEFDPVTERANLIVNFIKK